MVLVLRPLAEPLPREYVPLLSAPTTQRLILSPLSPEESLALVQRRLGVARLPDSVVALLLSRAQGNPFFLEELTYALRDSGKLQIDKEECQVAPGLDLQTLEFPENVQGVVTSRIDRLTPPEQLTLKVASVIGRTFAQNLLCDICPIEDDKPHLGRYLATLVQQSLTMPEPQQPEPAYSFKHAITQEVAYQMMAPAQRKRLHQAVAEWYEHHHPLDLASFFPLLAKHWCNTDQIVKAIAYLEKSGENAMRDFAHKEAVVFFSQALELDRQIGLTSDHFRRGCWERQLAEAYYNLGDLSQSLQHFRTALEHLHHPLPRTQWGTLLTALGQVARQVLHRLLPRWFVGKAGKHKAQHLEVARAYERVVEIYYLENEKISTMQAAFTALNLSETVGTCPELARNYAHATIFSGLLMQHRLARAYAERARVMAQAVQQPSCTAYVNLIRGVYWVTVGEWEAGEEDLVSAMQIAEHIGEKRRWYESASTLTTLLSRKGDYRRSARLCEELYKSATRRGVPQVQLWGLSWQLWCLLALAPDSPQMGQLETALAECLATHRSMPLGDQILGYGLLALARWRRGDADLALQTAEAAVEVMSRTNQVAHYLLCAYAALAEVYVGVWTNSGGEGGLQQDRQRPLRKLCRVLSQFSWMYPVGRPELWQVRGHYAWLCGRSARAYRAWRKSLAAAERSRMPYEAARAHFVLAQYLPAEDPKRALHREHAERMFTEIGAAYFLRQLNPPPAPEKDVRNLFSSSSS
jgi:tetratricopeptide (TPR) repeat protein